ncbi:AraC family transcriptional regulator [Halioxenophilus sp. WMMB6]|uniref:AraC family transcriptional regulator n=1 Tax=Halioxenophilus sp. WMMB6 TaxID=3073815 RepID=UPI00295E54CE|nr:AraC family transcriptional regulator [Halioxenophilus sp. WMMB6]
MTQFNRFMKSYWRPKLAAAGDIKNLPIVMELYGHGVVRPGYNYERKLARTVNVELVCRGEMTFVQGEQRQIVHAGEAVLMRPGVPQQFIATSEKPCVKRFIVLTGPSLFSVIDAAGVSLDTPIRISDMAHMQQLFRAIGAARSNNAIEAMIKASSLAFEILTLLGRCEKESVPQKLLPALARIRAEGDWPTLDELAELAGLSVSQFSRVFREHTGKSTGEYIKSVRLQRAAFYLQNSDWPVKKIAEQLGYDTPHYLTSQFTKYYGETPTNFRSELSFIAKALINKQI